MKKSYWIYMLTNFSNSVLYIGITDNLERRIYEHKNKLIEGFTTKYKVYKLVYFEEYQNVNEAISREKQLKNWHRSWKFNLIKKKNPTLSEIVLK